MPKEEPEAPKKRGIDPELQTMAKIDRLFQELPIDAMDRVLDWLVSRYRLTKPSITE